jgi:hypothetical protein
MADEERKGGDSGEEPGGSGPEKFGGIQPDSLFNKMGLDPSQPPTAITCYSGILGRSTTQGLWVLYLRLDMSAYLEIREEDIVSTQPLPPERSPFGSLGGTMVCVKKGALLNYVQTSSTELRAGAPTGDEFDLDIRLGAAPGMAQPAMIPNTQQWNTCFAPECGGGGTGFGGTCFTCASCGDTCFRTCDTCRTLCDQATCDTCQTCNTCRTQCGQATCGATCRTCQTQCGQATCATCQTRCGQVTCATCQTRCGQETCITCETRCGGFCGQTFAQTHCFTCRCP